MDYERGSCVTIMDFVPSKCYGFGESMDQEGYGLGGSLFVLICINYYIGSVAECNKQSSFHYCLSVWVSQFLTKELGGASQT